MQSPKERIETLYLNNDNSSGYLRVVREGSDYLLTVVGSYGDRGKYKIRKFDVNGNLIFTGIYPGTDGVFTPSDDIDSYYDTLFNAPFSASGIDNTPTSNDISQFQPNLTTITSDYSTVDGFGKVSIEQAIEYLTDTELADQPPVRDIFMPGTDMYNLDSIGAPEAWAVGLNGAGIIVAVLDTGVDVDHIDLANNIWVNVDEIANNGIDDDGNGFVDDRKGWDFVNNDSTVEDVDGHGTHVAGTIAAENNGIGVIGAAFNAKIMPIKILPDTGSGGSYLDLAEGVRYAVDNGAHVINMSLGGGYVPPTVIRDAIKYANDNGVICVMAAGNEFDSDPLLATSPNAPGSYASEYGIVVGAITETDQMTSFSNRAGEPVDWDLDGSKQLLYVTGAGQTIWSTTPNDTISTKNGTSMACPLVAAAVAIMLQADPSLNPDEIRVLLANTTV